MKDKVLLSTIMSTMAATISFILVDLLLANRINWQSTISFIIVFAVVFDITWRLRHRKNR
jgi:Na+-translocating ferredoxin:NAD+ oxidoreductase RnfA subunit